jgi:hypothetical protein
MTPRTDNRLDAAPMVSVGCERCGAGVLARKSSWNQTSVQWDAAASARCQERRDADKLEPYCDRGLFLACSAMNRSIVNAVQTGIVTIVD